MPAKKDRQDQDPPENLVMSYESLNDIQEKITGESLPNTIFEICNGCHWCATCINEKGAWVTCPVCGMQTSKIPIALDEIYIFEKDEKRGVTLRFVRKLPLR
jgi:hypothetical protein